MTWLLQAAGIKFVATADWRPVPEGAVLGAGLEVVSISDSLHDAGHRRRKKTDFSQPVFRVSAVTLQSEVSANEF